MRKSFRKSRVLGDFISLRQSPCLRFRLILGSGGAALHLASQPTLTEQQNRVFNSAIALWTTGTTTLIGLLGTTANKPHD